MYKFPILLIDAEFSIKFSAFSTKNLGIIAITTDFTKLYRNILILLHFWYKIYSKVYVVFGVCCLVTKKLFGFPCPFNVFPVQQHCLEPLFAELSL